MARSRSRPVFLCEGCGHESPRWMGFCPACGTRTPLVQFQPASPSSRRERGVPASSAVQELASVAGTRLTRLATPFQELDRVLGGGLVPGSVVLMAGEPGIGKSTLLLQTAQHLARNGTMTVYVSGEESPQQIRLRADRLGLDGAGVHLLAETEVDLILEHLERIKPEALVVDSIQTLHRSQVSSGPGSVAQVRECGQELTRWAKERAVPVLLAGHITKEGSVAGPMVLEHMVDVVLYLESDTRGHYRLLQSMKNRFGSTNETGIFQMSSAGMEEVADPSWAVLSQREEGAVGSALVPVMEGSRPLLVEVQALTCPTSLPIPRRTANGVDYNRLLMLVAVLTRRVGLALSNQDIIVNVAGGLRVREPAADLALCLAIVSSLRDTPLEPRLASFGEVGLSGELRPVPQTDRRLSEAARLGLGPCLVPATRQPGEKKLPVSCIFAQSLAEALRRALPPRRNAGASQSC